MGGKNTRNGFMVPASRGLHLQEADLRKRSWNANQLVQYGMPSSLAARSTASSARNYDLCQLTPRARCDRWELELKGRAYLLTQYSLVTRWCSEWKHHSRINEKSSTATLPRDAQGFTSPNQRCSSSGKERFSVCVPKWQRLVIILKRSLHFWTF